MFTAAQQQQRQPQPALQLRDAHKSSGDTAKACPMPLPPSSSAREAAAASPASKASGASSAACFSGFNRPGAPPSRAGQPMCSEDEVSALSGRVGARRDRVSGGAAERSALGLFVRPCTLVRATPPLGARAAAES